MAHLSFTPKLGWPAVSISILIVRASEKIGRCAGRYPFSIGDAQLAIKNGHRREEVAYKDRARAGRIYSPSTSCSWLREQLVILSPVEKETVALVFD